MTSTNNDKTEDNKVVRLTDNNTDNMPEEQNVGRFDTQSAVPTWESKGQRFDIHFKAMEQVYPAIAIEELKKWIGQSKPLSISVFANKTHSVAVSDAIRVAYDRGVILLKVIKEKFPRDEVSMIVIKDSSNMENTVVITKRE